MYHTNELNQVKLEKNLNSTRFSRKDSQFEGKILQILSGFISTSYFKNKTLADLVGCSTKTVTRITNKLQKDGLITKYQKNRYSPNHFTLTAKMKNGIHDYSKWVNSLSSKNQDLFVSHGIRVDHKNKVIFSLSNVPHNKSINLILDNLFINLSPSSREGRFFIKINDEKKGMRMDNYSYKPFVAIKPKEKTSQKRNTGGHSPAVVKPVQSLDDQIHKKRVDIAFFKVQIEKPETFWDSRSLLFSVQISATKNLLSIAQRDLKELEIRHELVSNKKEDSNEKQRVSHQYSSNSMATCTA
jgi:predicted transcriptional regulator